MPTPTTKVVDVGSAIPSSATTTPRRRKWADVVRGVVAVVASVVMAVSYMSVLRSYAQNDYFWTGFNASGAQTFVSDVYNAHLWHPDAQDGPVEVPLFSIDGGVSKSYATSQSSITIPATRSRWLALEAIADVRVAIAGLRAQTIRTSGRSLTCYCWLDFVRRWEVAHTAKRQTRCVARYRDNGAVYMEAMLRNVAWSEWSRTWGTEFEVAFGTAVRRDREGVAWLSETTSAVATTSLDDENLYWTQHGVVRFTLSWQNNRVGGFDDSVVVHNAVESFSLPLNHVVYRSRGAMWTSYLASVGVWNSLAYAVDVNASLVRSAPNSAALLPVAQSLEMWIGGYPDTAWSVLLHDTIGPIGSIDAFLVQPPRALLQLHARLRRSFLRVTQAHQISTSTPTAEFDMVPPHWRGDGVLYAGGNPLCYTGRLRSYVQQSIGFDDACTDPYAPLTVDATSGNLAMALWLVQESHGGISAREVCALTGNATSDACRQSITGAQQVLNTWLHVPNGSIETASALLPLAVQDTRQLQIEIIQYAASRNNSPVVLHQPLLDDGDPAWSFFGWLHLLDWVQGTREVVALDGDEATVVLMSKQYTPQSFEVDPLATPIRFAFTLWVVIWYINVVIFLVGAIALSYAALGQRDLSWYNMMSMNRVAGIVWIGRPLLMVRGLTALALLSTAKTELVTTNGFTTLSTTRRSAWEAFVVSGESLWLTYAMNDMLSLVTGTRTAHCGVTSCALVWSATLLAELLSPVAPSATVSRTCVSSNMESQVSCVSGDIEIGSSHRFVLLFAVQVGAVMATWLVAVKCMPRHPRQKVPVIVPAVACAHFDHEAGMSTFFDEGSNVLTGILPFRRRSQQFVFSVLLWVSLPVTSGSTLFRAPTLRVLSTASKASDNMVAVSRRSIAEARQHVRAALGLVFLVSSAASAASFFVVTKAKFTNNFLWEGFNSTGLLPFLVDWYNFEVLFRPPAGFLNMDSASRQAFYNATLATVSSSGMAPQIAQLEHTSLVNVIAGLQTTSGCDVPWIAAQYCWVDFHRQWEVANSATRQARCDRSNGAAYMDSVFRNTVVVKMTACWGDAIESSLFAELRKSAEGAAWVRAAETPAMLSPQDELVHWNAHNITTFTMQWQNYKSVGLVESVLVQSALGISYPLTMTRRVPL